MLERLRNEMAAGGIDWFIVFMNDEHLSEYTGAADRYIAALTGFTGSAGTLAAGPDEAYLWTDSRYYVQAAEQLEGTGIVLMKAGMPKVPTLADFLAEHVWEGQRIAFDMRTIPYYGYRKLTDRLPKSAELVDGGKILKTCVLMPKREYREIVPVPTKYCGRNAGDKLDAVREKIRKRYAGEESYTYILSDLTSIMWLFNLRGDDISHVPVAYSYAAVTRYGATLYLNRKALSDAARIALEDEGVQIKEYSLFYKDLADIATDMVLADPYYNNGMICRLLDDTGLLKECSDCSLITKSYKNNAEIAGMRSAHLKDAVTMIRFLKKIKDMASSGSLPDEYAIGKMLDDDRLSSGCSSVSFKTICAYGPNSAIVHYMADEASSLPAKPSGFLLVDSGGHYRFEGTTDITRTIALGPISDEEKKVYTTVLKGNLRLMDMIFPAGFKGSLLDAAAEEPLWSEGYFCGHGIGHGVGCYLSVHESEARISRNAGEREVAFFPGVIVSDEPGVYLEGKFGVRLENLLLTVKAEPLDGHDMCRFEPLTLVPFDKDAIDPELLTEKEQDILDRYNRLIVEKIGPLLTEEERRWLEEYL